MSMLLEGVDMPKGTNMILLITPEGEVWKMGDLMGNDNLIDGAKAIPAADVQPVVKAHWEEFGEAKQKFYSCSNCFATHYRWDNFCPNCGAYMRETNDGI